MAIKWTNKSAINREIDMAERHTDPSSSDFGVYAIAFATSLCFCEDISSMHYCVGKMGHI